MKRTSPRAGIGIGRAAATWPDADRQRRRFERMSAISGLVFAVLFGLAIVLVSQGPRLTDPASAYQAFYAGNTDVLAAVGLNVVPFAGIAFLWHLAAKRAMIRAFAPGGEIQGWLSLAAGLVFICMMFVGTAAVGAVALLSALGAPELPPPDVARALSSVGYGGDVRFRCPGGRHVHDHVDHAGQEDGCAARLAGCARVPRRHVSAGEHHIPPPGLAGVPQLGGGHGCR